MFALATFNSKVKLKLIYCEIIIESFKKQESSSQKMKIKYVVDKLFNFSKNLKEILKSITNYLKVMEYENIKAILNLLITDPAQLQIT